MSLGYDELKMNVEKLYLLIIFMVYFELFFKILIEFYGVNAFLN